MLFRVYGDRHTKLRATDDHVSGSRSTSSSGHTLSNFVSSEAIARLQSLLHAKTTKMTFDDYAENWTVLSVEEQKKVGISVKGNPLIVAVRTVGQFIGEIKLQNDSASGSWLLFDNVNWSGRFFASVRISQTGCLCLFNLHGNGASRIQNCWLRSEDQSLFWGSGATAVFLSVIELEGKGESLAVGDDSMISTGVYFRNHDMHSIIDLETERSINFPVSTTVERHVWLGQDVLILGCRSIGYGSIIGARSVAKSNIPAKVIAVGSPARVVAENRSWGRSISGINPGERAILKHLDTLSDQGN